MNNIINHYTIDKKTCDSRALPTDETPQAPSQNEDTNSEPKTGTPGESQGPSDYSKIREANIAQNKKILDSLGLGKGVGILGESVSKKKKKTK